jgi:hypothetical protein
VNEEALAHWGAVVTKKNAGNGRALWTRVLRPGSSVFRLLELRLRIPPGAWMSVSFECCVLSGRGLCVGLITHPEESH